LWIAGALHYQSASWIFSFTVGQEANGRSFWLLEGVLDSLAHGTQGILKAAIIVGLAAVAAVSLVLCYRSASPLKVYGMAVAGAVLLLCLFLSPLNLWAAVRFSRLLVLPLFWGLYSQLGVRDTIRPRTKALWAVMLVGALMSQFLYAWYTAEVFFQS